MGDGDLEVTYKKRTGTAHGKAHHRPSIAICLLLRSIRRNHQHCPREVIGILSWRMESSALARWIMDSQRRAFLTSRDNTDAKTTSWRGPPHRVRRPSGAAIGHTPQARERSACVARPWPPRQYQPCIDTARAFRDQRPFDCSIRAVLRGVNRSAESVLCHRDRLRGCPW